jgi:hypothetical protein
MGHRVALRLAYETKALPIAKLAEHFKVHPNYISVVAARENWKRDKMGAAADRREEILALEEQGPDGGIRIPQETKDWVSVETPPDDEKNPSRARIDIVGPISLDAQKALREAEKAMVGGSFEDAYGAIVALPEELRSAVAIELAARKQVQVVRDHKRKLGKLLATAERFDDALNAAADTLAAQHGPAWLLYADPKISQWFRETTGAIKSALSLERQAHGIDNTTEGVERIIPYADPREALALPDPFAEQQAAEGGAEDGNVRPEEG